MPGLASLGFADAFRALHGYGSRDSGLSDHSALEADLDQRSS